MAFTVRALRWEKRREEEEKRIREKEEIHVWNLILVCMEYMFGNFLCDVWNFGIGTTINISLSKLCMKNPIRSVVGWYKMSFMVYFEF